MSKENDLKNAIIELFRFGARTEERADRMEQILHEERIEYDFLLQALHENAETVYEYRMENRSNAVHAYHGRELFGVPATRLYGIEGDKADCGALCWHFTEVWLLRDMRLEVTSGLRVAAGTCMTEYRSHKGSFFDDFGVYIDQIAVAKYLKELSDSVCKRKIPKYEL